MLKKLLVLILVMGVVGVAVATYLYRKPAATTISSKADYTLQAEQLYAEFEQNEEKANEKYLNKVLAVRGRVAEVAPADSQGVALTLEAGSEIFGVSCQVADADKAARLQKGRQVLVKGLCTGKLMDVVLVKCSIEEL